MTDVITGALWGWFAGWPWYAHAALAAATALLAWVLFDKIVGVFRAVGGWGGWRAGVAALLAVMALAAALWPKPKPPAPPKPPPKKKARETLLDIFQRR